MLLVLIGMPASGSGGTAAHVHRILLAEAEAPQFVGGVVVLSYEPARPVRYVAALFEHEDFAVHHVFERNPNGILVLTVDPPRDVHQLRYRIVVDGLTMPDPNNPDRVRAASDDFLSVFDMPARPRPRQEGPRILDDGRVEFTYRGLPGQSVFLSASFSNWNPFLHRMQEVESGLYQTTVRVRGGTHYYQFLVNNQRITDPTNPLPDYTRDGRRVSRLDHPGVSIVNARR